MERHDTPDAPADDVRHRPAPPVAGPNVKNLLIATSLVLAALGATIAFLPGTKVEPAQERPAPPPPETTFLQQPPPQGQQPSPERLPWWDSVTVRPEPEPEQEEFADEAAFPDDAWRTPHPPAPPPPPDPRHVALERALKSSTLRRVGVDPPAHQRTTRAEVAPTPAAQAAALPGQMQATLDALMSPAGALLRAQGQPSPQPTPVPAPHQERGPAQMVRTALEARLYVRAGTLIPARLEAGINSDAPGPITARVLRDVVESTGGERVVIPAGAQLLGSVDQQLAYGEDRVLVAFDRVSFGGVTFELPGFDALEESGGRGLAGRVNHHLWPTLGRAALLAAIGAGFELSQPNRSTRDALTSGEIVASEVALNLHRVATQILSRGLDRRPTVKIPAGERFVIYLHRDLVL